MRQSIGRLILALASVLVLGAYARGVPAARPASIAHAAGHLIVTPASGVPGAQITVSAAPGYVPGTGTQGLIFTDPNGSTVTTLGVIQIASDGSFSTTVAVPVPSSGGNASISVQAFPEVSAPFLVLPTLAI